MSKWIDEILKGTSETESPERFQYWSAMCAIAATVRKNVSLDRYAYRLYPNIYVFLVAKSGLRKSNPVTLSRKLVTEANTTRVITGRSSIQAVLKELGKPHPVHDGNVLREASAFMVSGELAAFLVKDPDALTILTDLYDTYANEPEWKNNLKTAGVDVLKNPCITLLGATNEEHFRDAVPPNAIGGGFIARTIIVMEHKRRTINSLMWEPKNKPIPVTELGNYLKEVSKLKGDFKIHDDAKALFDQWYRFISDIDHEDRTGSLERLGDTVLKVSMLVSLANNTRLIIDQDNMQEAIDQCQECLAGLKQLTMGAGRSESAPGTALVIKTLLRKSPDYMLSKRQLLAKFWGEFDTIQLDRIIETLIAAGAVEVHCGPNVRDTLVVLKRDVAELYLKFKKEIN
jgi:hypothetical protein